MFRQKVKSIAELLPEFLRNTGIGDAFAAETSDR